MRTIVHLVWPLLHARRKRTDQDGDGEMWELSAELHVSRHVGALHQGINTLLIVATR